MNRFRLNAPETPPGPGECYNANLTNCCPRTALAFPTHIAPRRPLRALAFVMTCLALAACGGAGDGTDDDTGGDTTARAAAATATAESSTNACAFIRPFYWEVGDASAPRVNGSVNAATSTVTYTASSQMAVASASKWLYAAYVAERRNGTVTEEDADFLRLRSGYTTFDRCLPGETVSACASALGNSLYTPAHDGKFSYGGAHMQQHADLVMTLGAFNSATLANEVRSALGNDIALGYQTPQVAGGAVTTPAAYAAFLRKLMRNDLRLGRLLGAGAVCTNPATCATALSTPMPATESWHYGLGHWIEDDPVSGDGAFSSAGALGFYPWIAASKAHYGVIARLESQGGTDSLRCGRLIRKAWETGSAQ